MNKFQYAAIEFNNQLLRRPLIHVWFDQVDFDALIFNKSSQKDESKFGGNLMMAISGDLAQWYFRSDVNSTGPINTSLKMNGQIQHFDGLWPACAQAVNLWFPETLVMDVMINDKFGGAVADPVISYFKNFGFPVALVQGVDGYVNVEPLKLNGEPMLHRSRVVRLL